MVILTPYYYPVLGGITTFVDNLKLHLSKKNCTVFIISNEGNPDDDVKILKHGKFLFILMSYLDINKKKPDVLHSHSSWVFLAPCALYKIFHPKIRTIHTLHTDTQYKVRGYKKKILEFLFSKCDYVTFVSKDLMQKFDRSYDMRTQKRVIYPGVKVKSIKESDVNRFRDKYELWDKGPIISFIGPLVWKMKVEGVRRLINAFEIVREKCSKAKLLIIGDGNLRMDLEKVVKEHNMEKDVIFTGFIDNTFVPLSIIEIYTHISLQEGFPIALLEAMSMEKPIIATEIGGIPELIKNGKNGILVEPVPKKIAQTIVSLYNDKNRMRALGKNAKKIVNERYGWGDIAQEFVNLYEKRS